jgi:diguanylate cyclase (GGDEF)-like protein
MSAVEELKSYPIQRKGFMGGFYSIGGELFYTFGSLDKAEDYVLKALDIYKNDEFLGKWHTEILLQFINIQKNNDKALISESVKKIRNINSNYVSDIEKINNLYTLGFISKGNGDLSLSMELFDEANELAKKVNLDRVRVRTLYVKSISEKSVIKVKLLEEALELAKNEGLKGYEIFIYNSLGDHFFKQKEYYSAIKYYFEACEIIKKIAMQIPEEYRINYMTSLNYMHSFKRLIDINRIYSGRTINAGLDEIVANNLTTKALEDLFEYKDLFEILANKQFIKAAEKDYDYIIPKEIKNINDVINNLSGNSIKDLDLIVKLAAKSTLATRSYIMLVDENQDTSVVAAKDNNMEIPNIKFIIEKVNSTKEPLFIAERTNAGSMEDLDILPIGIKAAICIPILKRMGDETLSENDDRRKSIALQEQIVGYLYIDTERILNNFNSQAFNQCCQLRKLIQIIIDNYKLKIIASIDKLTGVFTRKYLEDALKEELERSSKNNSQFSLIMFDIDKFKNINDKFGHQRGDMVLSEICGVVKKSIRKEDTCGRYGGEEFVIILPGVNTKDAQSIAEKLRNKVEKAKILGDKYPVTMSLGVATYPQHGDMEQELIEKIDQALYVAKETGRNRSQVWNSQISNKIKRKDRLAGIVSGNMIQDNRNVLAMIELIELIKEDMNREDKIYKLLGRIIEISEAQNGMLFIVENGNVVNKYGRKKFEENWMEVKRFNSDILNTVIREKQGVYRVDWDDISEFDALTGNPDWQSIIVTPLIKSQKVKGILYLTVSTRAKEFDFNHFNFVNTLGDITAAIL